MLLPAVRLVRDADCESGKMQKLSIASAVNSSLNKAP